MTEAFAAVSPDIVTSSDIVVVKGKLEADKMQKCAGNLNSTPLYTIITITLYKNSFIFAELVSGFQPCQIFLSELKYIADNMILKNCLVRLIFWDDSTFVGNFVSKSY